MTTSLTRRLAWIARRPVDDATRARAALHLVDWLGCAVIGAVGPEGRSLAAEAMQSGSGPCTGIGAPTPLPPRAAAFLNGGLGNVMEMDDVHRRAILHPGPVVIPAALAAAQAGTASGAGLLDAIVRGYEAVIRVGLSTGSAHYALWHKTATCGPFGAAMATADILGLDEEATIWALGNAGTQASGPWRCRHEPVMTKQLHTARAAEAGLAAAMLARRGFTGPEWILEGAQGLYAAMCPDPQPDAIDAAPDAAWAIWETSFKPWPACRHAHAAIDAALAIRDRAAPHPGDIARIDIATYADALAFCDRVAPSSVIEAKFSLQHSVAVALADGPPTLDAFEVPAIERSDLASLRGLCALRSDDPFAGAYPAHFGAGVAVTMTDGTVHRAEIRDALGDPENPLDEAQVIGKARTLMRAAGMSPEMTEALIDSARHLPRSATLAGFGQALARCSAATNPEEGAT